MTIETHAFDAVFGTAAFCLGLRCEGDAVSALELLPPGSAEQPAGTALARRVEAQLRAYLTDPSHRFDLPVRAAGSPFRQRVWAAIAAIPPGQTRRYGELALQLRSAARAVGQACGDNPLPLVVPCHRVVAATGVGGFAHARDGYLLEAKRWLLDHEARLARV